MNWTLHEKVRVTVENYFHRNTENGNIDIPLYDLFVTELRKDWERAGYNLDSEEDLFKLWGALQVACASMAYMLRECKTAEELKGALKVCGVYGNMTGLFLREMTKNVPTIPPLPEEAADE